MDKKDKKQEVIVKICCVIAAFGLWLYTTSVINPVRTYSKTIPVTIVNQDKLSKYNLAIVANQQFKINLQLKGTVNKIYSIKESDFEVVMDLGEYALKKGQNNIPVKVRKSPDDVEVVNKENLWINVELDDLREKTVSLKVILTGTNKKGYSTMKPESNISDVKINGASSFVKSAYRAEARYDITNADKDLNVVVPIKIVDINGKEVTKVTTDPKFAQIKIPVRKPKTVKVNVKTTGKLKEEKVLSSIVSYPENIEIIGNEDVLKNVNSIDTEIINLSILDKNEIDVKLKVPKGVTLINNKGFVYVKINLKTVEDNKENDIISKNFKVNITTLNKDNKIKDSFTPTEVSLVLSGSKQMISVLRTEDIGCSIDLNNLGVGVYNIPVKISVPKGIKVESVSPQNIKVTIKSKTNLEDKNVN